MESASFSPSWRRCWHTAAATSSDRYGFWSTIARADPQDVQADPARLTVSYEVEYERVDESEAQEAVTLQLQRTEDGYLIAGQG